MVGMGRSTVPGMSSVMQSVNNDERERTEVDDGALHDQSELSTQKFEMLKDADDKRDLESVGADVRETVQGNPATLQTKFHQVHTPRQEPGSHRQETPTFAQDQGCGTIYASK